MNEAETQLDQLVVAALKSPKYRNVCEELVRHIGRRELAVRRSTREALKATKTKLHQVGSAYFEARIDYARALEELAQASASRDRAGLRQVCQKWMAKHSSTQERIEILDQFYATTLAGIRPLRVVLDVACGLNPLAIPWMPLDEGATYYAYDVYTDLVRFIQDVLPLLGVQGQAQPCDVIQSPPGQTADLALILKAIPCLEQVDKTAGGRLLEAIRAHHLLVSFPVYSLGGRSKGMVENYEARFRELVRGQPWSIQRFEFATELAFLITKRGTQVAPGDGGQSRVKGEGHPKGEGAPKRYAD
jgi:16S rRNA (guanine(1405)-N(7))-methyltransferase